MRKTLLVLAGFSALITLSGCVAPYGYGYGGYRYGDRYGYAYGGVAPYDGYYRPYRGDDRYSDGYGYDNNYRYNYRDRRHGY